MIKRFIEKELRYLLTRIPAIALIGPRQVGKTTLALHVSQSIPSVYLDLESPEGLLKLRDPLSFFKLNSDKLIILDELQRAPDLFPVIRGVIDDNRRSGKRSGQFLFLGSASIDLLKQSSESLAGRIHYLSMSGITAHETGHSDMHSIHQLWLRGGFPDSYLAHDDQQSTQWLEMLIRTYLERDLPQFGFRVPANRLRRLWTMLAHLQGETINYSKLATNLEVDAKTVTHYLDILQDLLLVRRLQPWFTNVKKRLVKSPRCYIRDSGLLHRLLSIKSHEDLITNPVLGKSWEGFVLENLLSIAPMETEAFYYRTSSGAEIDLLLKLPGNELWAIEIKHGLAPRIQPGFHLASEDVKATRKLIVYGGEDIFPIEKSTTMISLNEMIHEIAG
ncbi:MAG: ATP-binding protein [Gammaproteobacteria bacterium]|nr:ATP-binding protein [Gammaproteobacteria bacterium]